MPGLYGVVGVKGPGLRPTLAKMGETLEQGRVTISDLWTDPKLGVGLGREVLGIFNEGPQPVFDPQRLAGLVMEGEVYDKDQVRQDLSHSEFRLPHVSDPELALYAYLSQGVEGLCRLHGLFTLALWDFRRRELILINDRFGLRSVYYHIQEGRFSFASEVKGLMALGNLNLPLDDSAIAEFFAFNYLTGDKTFFKDVRLMPGATVMRYRDGLLTKNCYWDLVYREGENPRPESECVEELIHLLTQAVERRMGRDLQVGLPLSGGLDSRTLLGVIKARLGLSVPTFTYGQRRSRDLRRGKRLARRAGVPHQSFVLGESYIEDYAGDVIERAEGMMNCLESHGFQLNGMADTCQTMMLGNPGGALFQTQRARFRELQENPKDPVTTCFQSVNDIFSEEDIKNIFFDSFYRRLKGLAYESFQRALNEIATDNIDDLLDSYRLRNSTRRSLVAGLFTIRHHMEFNEPYYDYDLIDFALRLPVDMRWNRRIQKTTLAEMFPRLASVEGGPLERRQTWVEKQWRRGRGKIRYEFQQKGLIVNLPASKPTSTFADFNSLLRKPNREWVERVLLSSQTLSRGYYMPESIQQLIDAHMSMKKNLGLQLGTLITFELWHRKFID